MYRQRLNKAPAPADVDPDIAAAYGDFPGLGNWENANQTANAALESFTKQTARIVEGAKPSEEELELLAAKLFELYPKTSPPKGFDGKGVNEAVMIDRIAFFSRQVVRSSKPGIPYHSDYTDNGVFVDQGLETLTKLVLDRLKLLCHMPAGLTAAQIVAGGYADPVRVFVKNEPHSKKKVEQGRWRLIFAVSLVDQVIERIMCSAQNNAEIDGWKRCPSAPGLSLQSDENLKDLHDHVVRLAGGKPLAEADVTGWDWSVKEWELVFDGEIRIRLGGMQGFAARVMRARVLCASRSVYCMPDGRLLVHKNGGVQISGSYNTSSTNSRLRVAIAFLSGASWAFAMGDDCLEEYQDDAPMKYAALGHPLKMYTKKDPGASFEFCSTNFSQGVCAPVDYTKTFYRILSQKSITLDLWEQFAEHCRHVPELKAIAVFIGGWKATSPEARDACYSMVGGGVNRL